MFGVFDLLQTQRRDDRYISGRRDQALFFSFFFLFYIFCLHSKCFPLSQFSTPHMSHQLSSLHPFSNHPLPFLCPGTPLQCWTKPFQDQGLLLPSSCSHEHEDMLILCLEYSELVPQWRNGYRKCGVFTHWNTTQQLKTINS